VLKNSEPELKIVVMHGSRLLLLGMFCLTTCSKAAELSVSGYGSIVGGRVLSGDGYWARMPEGAGQYGKGLELKTESRFGLQGIYEVDDNLDLVGQVVARGINDFSPRVAWLYGTFNLSSERQFKFGRLRLPVYHFSDVMDVGVAYPWIRVPSDAYSLAVTDFDGVMLNQRWNWHFGVSKLSFYAGQRDTDPNKLLTTIEKYKNEQRFDDKGQFIGFGDIRTTKFYRDMRGLVLENSAEWLTVRFSYLKGRENFSYFDAIAGKYQLRFGDVWTETRFLDGSFQVDFNNWLAMAEWNYYRNIYKSWFTSVAYNFERWTPYVYLSGFKGIQSGQGNSSRIDDHYQSLAIGTRYDLTSRIALKVEVTRFSDIGESPVFIDRNNDGDTDASAIVFSLDFSF
jgi:hypothetical protein